MITTPSSQGSGVILKHEGDIYTVLTSAHVVKKKVNYKITTPDDKQYEVMLGRYSFALPEAIQKGELRSLREPASELAFE